VAQDVPRFVDPDHLADVATEVRMMTPSEVPIGTTDRGAIGIRIDVENGVQAGHETILPITGSKSTGRVGNPGGNRLQQPSNAKAALATFLIDG
jgi:hypothetical protein